MSKIQNAEEFANEIWADVEYTGSCLGIQAVRSRDRAIRLETAGEIVDRLRKAFHEAEGVFVGNSGRLFTRDDIFTIFDSVLRELEG